jgi:hypothetical protein
LSQITLTSPASEIVLYSPPTFTWEADGGTDNRYAVDLSFDWTFASYFSTLEDLHQPLSEPAWQPPQGFCDRIPSGNYMYWRVRGADKANKDNSQPDLIVSTEVRWFYKY